jgi:hypothetical protein
MDTTRMFLDFFVKNDKYTVENQIKFSYTIFIFVLSFSASGYDNDI